MSDDEVNNINMEVCVWTFLTREMICTQTEASFTSSTHTDVSVVWAFCFTQKQLDVKTAATSQDASWEGTGSNFMHLVTLPPVGLMFIVCL